MLAKLFNLVSTGQMSSIDPNAVSAYCVNLLSSAFPHMQPSVPHPPPCVSPTPDTNPRSFVPSAQITELVANLREQSGDSVRFKVILRDFVVLLREHQGGDAAIVFTDEKEAAMEQKADEDRQRAAAVPGLLKVRSFPSVVSFRPHDGKLMDVVCFV